jgi:hypothetical protein
MKAYPPYLDRFAGGGIHALLELCTRPWKKRGVKQMPDPPSRPPSLPPSLPPSRPPSRPHREPPAHHLPSVQGLHGPHGFTLGGQLHHCDTFRFAWGTGREGGRKGGRGRGRVEQRGRSS